MSKAKAILILNGPPGCGKDTLAKMLAERNAWLHYEFKDVLYKETAEYYGVSLEEMKFWAVDRKLKDEIWPEFEMTPRAMLIHVSEDICKPMHGEDYFGRQLGRTASMTGSEVVVSDGGFEAECLVQEDYFENVWLIRLWRDGCSFENDSRDYIYCIPQ